MLLSLSALFANSVIVGRSSVSFRALFSFLLALFLSSVAFAQSSTYDSARNSLFIPQVVVTGLTYQNVNVSFSSLGSVRVNDASVGTAATYDLAANVLRLPQVSVGGTTYSKVSLTGATFTVTSYGSVVAGTGDTSQKWAVNITASALGYTIPVRVNNVPKPASSTEFCNEESYQMMDQAAQAFSATYRVTGCSYAGSVGNLSGVLYMDGSSYPVSAVYSYVAM
jgi:hypothetical protein